MSVRDGETLLLGADHDEVVTAVEVAAPCAVNKAEVTHRVDVPDNEPSAPTTLHLHTTKSSEIISFS